MGEYRQKYSNTVNKMRHIYTIGETTFDIIFKNNEPKEAKVGGSQLNTAITLGRLNLPVSFISQFGNDRVGNLAQNFLKENGVSIKYVNRHHGNSRIALAFLDENNNAEYTFYKPAVHLEILLPELIGNDILLFGSSYSLKESARDGLSRLLQKAKTAGSLVIYDPNFRKTNLHRLGKLMPIIKENIKYANILKGSDEDFALIFQSKGPDQAFQAISKIKNLPLIYTANEEGVSIRSQNFKKDYDVPVIKPISTIGAGDNFTAGIIYTLIKNNIGCNDLSCLDAKGWDEIIKNAISFAQHVCCSWDNYISNSFAAKHHF